MQTSNLKIIRLAFFVETILLMSSVLAQDMRGEIAKAGMWGRFSQECSSPAVPSKPQTHKFEFMFVEDRFVQRVYFDEKNPGDYRDRIIRNIKKISGKDTLSNPPVDAPLFEYWYTATTPQGERDFRTWRRITANEHKVWETLRLLTLEERRTYNGPLLEGGFVPLVKMGKSINAQGQPGNDVPVIKRCDNLETSKFGKLSKGDANNLAAQKSAEQRLDHGKNGPTGLAREALIKDAGRIASSQYLEIFDVDCDTQGQQHKALCLKPIVRERANLINQLFKQILAHPKYKIEVLKHEPQWERFVKENAKRPEWFCTTYECFEDELDKQIYRLKDTLALLDGLPSPTIPAPAPGTVPTTLRGEFGESCDLRFNPNSMDVLEPGVGRVKNHPNRKILRSFKITKVEKDRINSIIIFTENGSGYHFYTTEGEGPGARYPWGTILTIRLDSVSTNGKRVSVSNSKPLPDGSRCEPYRSETPIEN